MLFFKNVLFALISSLTLYIRDVYNLTPKRGSRPLPTPLIGLCRNHLDFHEAYKIHDIRNSLGPSL